jgi:hypothetical protein
MIGEAEGKPSIRLGFRFEPLVEDDRRLAWFAQPANDPQFPAGDHRLIDHDVGQGGRHAGDENGPSQQALEHRAFPSET